MIYIMFDCSSRVLFTALRASTFDDTAFGDGTAYATTEHVKGRRCVSSSYPRRQCRHGPTPLEGEQDARTTLHPQEADERADGHFPIAGRGDGGGRKGRKEWSILKSTAFPQNERTNSPYPAASRRVSATRPERRRWAPPALGRAQ